MESVQQNLLVQFRSGPDQKQDPFSSTGCYWSWEVLERRTGSEPSYSDPTRTRSELKQTVDTVLTRTRTEAAAAHPWWMKASHFMLFLTCCLPTNQQPVAPTNQKLGARLFHLRWFSVGFIPIILVRTWTRPAVIGPDHQEALAESGLWPPEGANTNPEKVTGVLALKVRGHILMFPGASAADLQNLLPVLLWRTIGCSSILSVDSRINVWWGGTSVLCSSAADTVDAVVLLFSLFVLTMRLLVLRWGVEAEDTAVLQHLDWAKRLQTEPSSTFSNTPWPRDARPTEDGTVQDVDDPPQV